MALAQARVSSTIKARVLLSKSRLPETFKNFQAAGMELHFSP
jgi:hypothetical protein